ncbi:MAG: NADAR family protein [Abditibacteriota bacterium]|nr:NADAR family protein [Abditibacteriota bacterium]
MYHSDIIGFYSTRKEYGCFSNWYRAPFTYAGVRYSCVEQYMMAQKVVLGNRFDLLDKIMAAGHPGKMKALAGKDSYPEFMDIKPVWDMHCRHIVKRGVKARFLQNPEDMRELLDTGSALLCECSPDDRIWGIGIEQSSGDWRDEANWNGSNYLGIVLMEAREELRREIYEKGAAEFIDFRNAPPVPQWLIKAGELRRIPQYYPIIHAYCDQIPSGEKREAFYSRSLREIEGLLGAGDAVFPRGGFFEMKQEIYETARSLAFRHFVSEVFGEPPARWGTSGDPYFWDALKNRFLFTDIDTEDEVITESVYGAYKEKTGRLPEPGAAGYVEEYDRGGGMSAGCVSGEWVVSVCIPTIIERLEKLREEHKKW